ncbi:MAG: acetyl-CoA C-acyltransferase [Magnetococcales bacterium]|nr:acetyl-CoA C-acyltransferase [Magnetococcales bacterium]
MASNTVVIAGYARTPMGAFQGDLAPLSATYLGSVAIEKALQHATIDPELVDETIMGLVLSAGLGQAPARQAAIGAGVPLNKPATTINKMCGSGLKAVMMAHDQIQAGSAKVMVAGGMESMSNAPYLMPKVRAGLRMGHAEMKDHMFLDGLEDAYDKGTLMGCFADKTAERYNLSREMQDDFAIESVKRAQKAAENGWFEKEIAPVTIEGRKGVTVVEKDESPQKAKLDKIPQLKPAFAKDGTVTAANASSISDGAAALVLMSQEMAEIKGVQSIAKICAQASYAHEPEWFTTAPVGAISSVLEQAGWTVDDVDVFEINEAFAAVTLAAMQELDIPHSKVNIHGGACALGHPIGASGARVLVTLLAALKRVNGKKGVASLCIGGGEAVAMAVELL